MTTVEQGAPEAGDARRNTAERIAAELRDEIARGVWSVDDQLPAEHQLMERFGVSRPSCREALRILQSEGLVLVQRGNRGGARVMPPDPIRIASYASVFLQMRKATITEVFETRMVIEPAVLQKLAGNCSQEFLSRLAQNAASQRYIVDDRPAFYRRGRDFRQMFVDACQSETLRLMGLMVGEIADRQLSLLSHALPYSEGQRDRFLHAIAMKESIIEALGAGRGDDAGQTWREYLRFYLDNLHRITPVEARRLQPFPMD